jgi:hypothetical protein
VRNLKLIPQKPRESAGEPATAPKSGKALPQNGLRKSFFARYG